MDDQAFRKFYEFDDDDLDANRQGRLSDKQYKRLTSTAHSNRGAGKVVAVISLTIAALAPCCLLPLGFLAMYNHDWVSTIIAWVGGLVWLAIFGGVGVFFVWGTHNSDPVSLAVSKAEGQVELTEFKLAGGEKYNSHFIQHSMNIGTWRFDLDDDLVGHITEGETIAVYVAVGRIMSLEHVAGKAIWQNPA